MLPMPIVDLRERARELGESGTSGTVPARAVVP